MGKSLPDRQVRRKAFLRALTSGLPVGKAAEQARIAWSTLYAWRRDEPKFRASWDRAAGNGQDALAERFQSALYQRAVDGVDDPVYHAGEVVGRRKRYSDRLLLHALNELARLRAEMQKAAPAPPPEPEPPLEVGPYDKVIKVGDKTVIVRSFRKPPEENPATARAPAASEAPASEAPCQPQPPPAPAAAPALCWAHLNRREL